MAHGKEGVPSEIDRGDPITIPISPFDLGKFLAGIIGAALRWIWDRIRTLVGGFLTYSTVLLFHSMAIVRPEATSKLMRDLVFTYLPRTSEWGPIVEQYMKMLTGIEVKIPDAIIGGRNVTEAIGKALLDPMLSMVLPEAMPAIPGQSGITPEYGKRAAESYLGVNLSFNMQGWLMSLMAELFGGDVLKTMRQLPNQISWAFGFGWLSWLVMGVPFRMAIADPFETYLNRIYRPRRLSKSEIMYLYSRGRLSPQEAGSLMADLGYNDDQIADLLEMEAPTISEAALYDLLRLGYLRDEDVLAYYEARGYGHDNANMLTARLTSRKLKEILDSIADVALSQYQKEAIDEETLRPYLQSADYSETEIELLIAKAELKKMEPPEAVPKERGLTTGMIGGLYRDGKRTEDWTRIKLAEIAWRPEEIDDFLLYYQPKVAAGRTGKELTAAMIGSLFKRNLLTQMEAEEMWLQAGVRKDHIPYYVMYYKKPPEVPTPMRPPTVITPAGVGRLHKEMIITTEEAISLLNIFFATPEDEATLFLALYPQPEAAPPPEPGLSVYDIASAVATGAISLGEGVDRLVARGWDRGYAEAYLRSEWAYRVASDAARDCILGVITFAEAVARMVAAGWGTSDAEIYLKTSGCKP